MLGVMQGARKALAMSKVNAASASVQVSAGELSGTIIASAVQRSVQQRWHDSRSLKEPKTDRVHLDQVTARTCKRTVIGMLWSASAAPLTTGPIGHPASVIAEMVSAMVENTAASAKRPGVSLAGIIRSSATIAEVDPGMA